MLPEIADLAALYYASLVDAAAGWSRTENAACARKLAIISELFARRTGLPAGERENWWVDPQAAVGAELGAAQGISTWMALAHAHRGVVLADRLPKVAALFEAGVISELLVRVIEYRTALITDPDAMAAVDELLADHVGRWGPLSANKTEQAIDAIVDQVDPGALRRSRKTFCRRDVQFGSPNDEAGFTILWARMYAPDAAVLKKRVEEMVHGVCDDDPRTRGERRTEALAALAAGIRELACECGNADCRGAQRHATPPAAAVIHVVADADAVEAARTETAGTARPADPALAEDAQPQPAFCPAPPAFVIGGGVLPPRCWPPCWSAPQCARSATPERRHPNGDTPHRDRWPILCGAVI